MGKCIVIDVDGEPVRLQLAPGVSSLSPEDEEAMRIIVRSLRSAGKKKRKVRIVRNKK